jgi:hypothetical protein
VIVGIVAKAVSGIVQVDSFWDAPSEADALDRFCNSYNPPQIPAAWSAINTGWATYQSPGPTNVWAYDFTTSLYVVKVIPTVYVVAATSLIVPGVQALVGGALQETAGLVAAPYLLVPDPLTSAIVRLNGLYRTTGVGAALRLQENGIDISPQLDLTDTAGVWTFFTLNASIALNKTMNIYTLMAMLGAATAADVKYVSLSLVYPKS